MSKSKLFYFGYTRTNEIFLTDKIYHKNKKNLIDNHLRNIAIHHNLCSLASPQIGQYWKAFVIIKKDQLKAGKWTQYKNLKHSSYDSYLNPQIIDFSQEEIEDYQECCGYPGLKMLIKRSRKIKARYSIDKKLQDIEEQLADFRARVYQHEFHHLQCIDPLKIATKVQIIDPKLRDQHNASIQQKFQAFLAEKAAKKDLNNAQTNEEMIELYKTSRAYNQLRREITYTITDHYCK